MLQPTALFRVHVMNVTNGSLTVRFEGVEWTFWFRMAPS